MTIETSRLITKFSTVVFLHHEKRRNTVVFHTLWFLRKWPVLLLTSMGNFVVPVRRLKMFPQLTFFGYWLSLCPWAETAMVKTAVARRTAVVVTTTIKWKWKVWVGRNDGDMLRKVYLLNKRSVLNLAYAKIEIERNIASISNKQNSFLKKWSSFIN